ncbi:MAG: menaquinone biosynthesis protein [Planctomycetota bacterium]
MTPPSSDAFHEAPPAVSTAPGVRGPRVVGCVPYLNAKPLIHGLEDARTRVLLDVPSRLVGRLLDGECDVALCSVIDACRHPQLAVVPGGGIGCAGPTWTVRLFSRVPVERIGRVHLDADSHTSVMLLRVLLAERFGLEPATVGFDFRGGRFPEDAEAVLLIGDKVVTHPPPAGDFPFTLDLGEHWHRWTSGPFVFAAWLARRDAALGDLPVRLAARRAANLADAAAVDGLLDGYAASHGWPRDLARDYWTRVLRYGVGAAELDAVRRFAEACRRWLGRHPEAAALGPIRDPDVLPLDDTSDAPEPTPAKPVAK